MKKRLYAIFMTSVLLVGIMAGSALASDVKMGVKGPWIEGYVSGTDNVTKLTTYKATITMSREIYVGEVVPISVDLKGTEALAPKATGSYATMALDTTATTPVANQRRYLVTGKSAGTSEFLFTSADSSTDIQLTVKVKVKEGSVTTNAPADGIDLGAKFETDNKNFMVGYPFDTSFDVSFDFGYGTSPTSMKATLNKAIEGFKVIVTPMSWDTLNSLTTVEASTDSGITETTTVFGKSGRANSYRVQISIDKFPEDITKDTTYTLNFEGKDGAGKATFKRKYTFTVWALPTLEESVKIPDITWGDPTWAGFSPKVTFADKVDISVDAGVSGDAAITGLKGSADLKYEWKGNASAGTATFSLNNTKTGWKPGRNNNYIIPETWKGDDITKTIKFIAYRGKGAHLVSKDQNYDLTFKGTAVKWLKTADEYAAILKKANYTYSQDINSANSADFYLTVEGPGMITFTSEDLPAGIKITMSNDVPGTDKTTYTRSVYVHGKPNVTANGDISFTVTAKSSFDTEVPITIPLYIGTNSVDISYDVPLMSSDAAVDGTYKTVKLTAEPGPVVWTTSNLPAGVTLEVDGSDSTKATLSGTFTTPTTANETKYKHYTITATNAYDNKKSKTISEDLMVWAPPVITAPSGAGNLATNKAIKVPFTVENLPGPKSWEISINGTKIVEPKTNNDYVSHDAKGYAIKGRTPSEGYGANSADLATSKYFISVDIEALSKDRKVVLIGSTDRVPEGGEPLTVSITAENFAGKTTEEFALTFKGVEPKVAKTDVSLKWDPKATDNNGGKGTSKDVKLSAGDELVTVTAVIDAKTAKKVFGIDSEINLMDENDENRKKAGLSVDQVDGKGTLKVAVISSQDAYSKLPIKVTAENPDVSSKASTAVYSLTVAGTAPTWSADNTVTTTMWTDAGVTTNLKADQASGAKALPAAVTINMKAGGSLGEGIKLHANGSGPFTYSVKPASKNGIEAAMSETEGEERTLIIKGTADDVKKDTATKFTIEAKNNSTGASAKIAVTVNIIPKVAVAENEIASKNLTFGKKVNLKPKTTSTGKNVTWYVLDSGRADLAVPTNTALTADAMKTEADDLKNNFGLVLDTKKGGLSGTPTISTGSENPIVVYAVASGDIERSDPVKYTVTVLGEKVKLTTKSVTITAEDPNFDSVKIETNVTGKADTAANISAGSANEHNGTTANFADITEVAGLTLADKGDKTNQFTLSGTPSGVTKKAAVTLTMVNYDTTSTGKLSVVVTGSTPTIEATDGDTVAVDAGSEGSTSVAITNPEYVSSKIKWKITDKPTLKGVSAKLTDNKDGTASITVKAGGKVKTGDTTFKVQATDGISKKSSEKLTITVNVTGAEESTEEAATVLSETSTELEETEKTALGEGEVIMGAQRTAGSLTAGQRAYIEQQGYVIAAVLPQIEVTADGQYDFEVDLDEKVATGAELVWFAFASKPTTDDEIVDFADKDNNETKVVPESHVVIVTPWLNAGTKYAPVIAVKANAAEADAMTEEGVKEAAEEEQEQAE